MNTENCNWIICNLHPIMKKLMSLPTLIYFGHDKIEFNVSYLIQLLINGIYLWLYLELNVMFHILSIRCISFEKLHVSLIHMKAQSDFMISSNHQPIILHLAHGICWPALWHLPVNHELWVMTQTSSNFYSMSWLRSHITTLQYRAKLCTCVILCVIE